MSLGMDVCEDFIPTSKRTEECIFLLLSSSSTNLFTGFNMIGQEKTGDGKVTQNVLVVPSCILSMYVHYFLGNVISDIDSATAIIHLNYILHRDLCQGF